MGKHESADLILKLYDLRREKTKREARTWFAAIQAEKAAKAAAAGQA